VDVATGAGPVALAIAAAMPKARVWGIDIAPKAVKVAKENARLNQVKNARFRESDMLRDLPQKLRGKVDAFTLHPPYVSRGLVKTLAREIRDFEPPESLTDNSVDGLGLVRKLGAEAGDWLRPDGWALVEVSPDLARGVRSILSRAGFKELRSLRDELGATRVIAGHL
jgi:release factor glutamine methyltransferase